ncbi:hypothetical protein EZS27_031321 [termite gut metagenome]|uniref:Uncharacterized protein n=1 Tax=termite gut metagenome TaxID=433724 RepID=A0A5J4QAM5_9ZZZZ
MVEELFALFLQELESLNLVVHEGKIIDAGFVEVPRSRNRKEENELIKKGKYRNPLKRIFIYNSRKMWMFDGQRKTRSLVSAIRIM